MPPKKSTPSGSLSVPAPIPVSISPGTVKIDTFIFNIRELCRGRGLQIWNKTSLSDLIYKDILFLHSLPRLQRAGYLNLDVEYIGIPEPSFAGLMSLKEPELINAAFKRLWKQLQVSTVSKLFDGRDFAMAPIEKKDATKYLALLTDILKYASRVELAPFDSDSGHTYFNKDLNKANAKTFGQFYTPGSVVKSIVQELTLTSKDTLLDPSCGSCSFLQEASDNLMKKEGLTAEIAFKNLYGVEVEPNIYIDGLMNTFTRFGMLPDMEDNIREADAFKVLLSEETQYDKIPANPPFGADAKSFQEFYFKTTMEPKGKKLVKKTVVNPDLKFQIPFPNTGESAILFFQMIVQKLKHGGKAGVVMSSTILNDGHREMMKWFFDTCSLEKIIINPAGTFKEKGTGIETFSFIFTKGVPTTEIKIVMLGEEDTVVRTLTLDKIKEAGWKLQLKEEEKKVAYTGVYELKKLGDVAKVLFGERITQKDNTGTIYPVYGSGYDTFKTDKSNRDGKTCKLGRFAISETNMAMIVNGPYWLMDSGFTVESKNEEVMLKEFLWNLLLTDKNRLSQCSTGSCQKNIEMDRFYTLDYPCPPLPIQQEIVANLDRIFANQQDMKDYLAFTDKAMDLMLKDPTGKQLEDVLGGLMLKRAYKNDGASVKSQMAAIVRSVGARGFERKKLGDLYDCPKTIKRFNSGDRDPTGNIPFFNGKWSCPDGTHTDYSFDLNSPYLVMIKDGGGDHDSDTVGMGKFFKVKGKCAITSHNMVLTPKPENGIEYDFIYHYLTMNAKSIRDMATYSINLGGISKESIVNYEIPVPPLPIQHEVLAILNEMEAELQTLEQMAAKAEQRAKFILDGYLTPANQAVEAEPSAEPVLTTTMTTEEAPKKRKFKVKQSGLDD